MHNAYMQVLESLYFLVHAHNHRRDCHMHLHNPRRDRMSSHMYSRDQNRRTCESSRDYDLYTVIIM